MNYVEMLRIASDPEAVQRIARSLLVTRSEHLSRQEKEFLTRLTTFKGPEPLAMRDRERLYDIRSRAKRRSMVRGFRASNLAIKLQELRLEIDEGHEDFINWLRYAAQRYGRDLALSDAQWRYVFRLCHQAGEIENYMTLD